MGLYGLGVVVAPAVGPTLGGYLVEYVDWRLIFFINVPIGILGAIAAYLLLPTFPGRPAGRFDVLGFVTIASGLSALLLALSEGQSWGWTAYPTRTSRERITRRWTPRGGRRRRSPRRSRSTGR